MDTRHSRALWIGPLLSVATLIACTDRRPVPSDVAFNFTNGPASPGPYIVRIENSGSRVITSDPSSGLFAVHGRIRDLAECTNASTRVPVDIQIVRTPSDAQGMALLLAAQENDVAIYDEGDISEVSPFDPAKFCAFIATVEPAYQGVVKYRLHINGQASQHFQWEGELTSSDGDTVHYVENQHFVASGNDEGRWVTEEIRIQ
jgi:hypothetical protein